MAFVQGNVTPPSVLPVTCTVATQVPEVVKPMAFDPEKGIRQAAFRAPRVQNPWIPILSASASLAQAKNPPMRRVSTMKVTFRVFTILPH